MRAHGSTVVFFGHAYACATAWRSGILWRWRGRGRRGWFCCCCSRTRFAGAAAAALLHCMRHMRAAHAPCAPLRAARAHLPALLRARFSTYRSSLYLPTTTTFYYYLLPDLCRVVPVHSARFASSDTVCDSWIPPLPPPYLPHFASPAAHFHTTACNAAAYAHRRFAR